MGDANNNNAGDSDSLKPIGASCDIDSECESCQ